jgi:hypothetical protein
MKRLIAVWLAGAAVAAGGAQAHHGWGSYDAAKLVTISAPVEQIVWQNPHVHLMVRHDDAEWEATLAPISRMQIRGLSENMLQPGKLVTLVGYASTAKPNELRAERITVDSKTFELR